MRIEGKTPEQILNENDVWIVRGMDNKGWEFGHKGKRIPQPEPWKCYETLIREFGITEPRLKDWR